MDDTRNKLLRMFILDVLRHDVAEQVPAIVRLLNNRGCIGWRGQWPREFEADEVRSMLTELVKEGLVLVFSVDEVTECLVPESHSNAEQQDNATWFGSSPAGNELWENWTPPVSS
jgi:hypothetical protein